MTDRTRIYMTVLLGAVALSGCRTSVHRVEMERVDQNLAGNRGYFAGTAPAAGPRRETRDIAELQVELPMDKAKARKTTRRRAAPVETVEAPVSTWDEPAPTTQAAAPMSSETYVVQKGDTLWSIARKMYGKGSQWPRIYDANRDQLAEPGRMRYGMQLMIPRGEGEPSAPTESYGK